MYGSGDEWISAMGMRSQRDAVEDWKAAIFVYQSALKEINTKIEILNQEFINMHNYNPIEHVTSRIKKPESIMKKLEKQGRDVTLENMRRYIHDIAGVRIICSFESDIYKIADMIANQSDVTVKIIKNYIEMPKPNGYKSYHMVIALPIFLSNGPMEIKVEIQIRTIAMDFWASLEHKIKYKFEGKTPPGIQQELKECADIVDMLDKKMYSLNEEVLHFSSRDEQ